jgi:hypothetical protein
LRISLIIIGLNLFAPSLKSQVQDQYPFKIGEEITYEVYYNLAFVWVDAADVSFFVTDTLVNNQKHFFFKSSGSSKPNYDWIFKVRDHFEVIANINNLKPLLYHRNTKEGSNYANNYYLFDSPNKTIYSVINNNTSNYSDTLLFDDEVRDVLSSVYYLRNLDLDNYKKDEAIIISTVMDNQIVKLKISYCGKELVEHKNGISYLSHKLRTKGVEGSIFDKDSEIFVWVSADNNRIPIKVESEILVGSVQAYLKSVRMPKEKQSIIINSFVLD